MIVPTGFYSSPTSEVDHLSTDPSMNIPFDKARKFFTDDEGAALAEYGILVAFIAIVAITAVTFFGSKVSAKFSQLGNSFS
ncbi:MAG: Flp family type IVb pilin [Gemmatimonas sp.]